jgi:hypothetical protein
LGEHGGGSLRGTLRVFFDIHIRVPSFGHLRMLQILSYGIEEETSAHVLCECEALANLRHTYLGSLFLDPEDVTNQSMGEIWNFGTGTGACEK